MRKGVQFLAELETLGTLLVDGKTHHTIVTNLHPQPDTGCLAMTLDILHKYVGLLELCEEAVLAHTVLTDSAGKGQT